MQIDIKKLTPSLAQDFLGFFDDDAFSDNPDWSGCYCSFFYFGDDEWHERTGSMNRAFSEQAIISGSINGYLAYVDGKPAGWINADRKEAYARLEQNGGDKKVLSIVCFTVSPGHRRKGIAGKLLQAALEGAKREGYEAVEAYPAKKQLRMRTTITDRLSCIQKTDSKLLKKKRTTILSGRGCIFNYCQEYTSLCPLKKT